MGPSSKLSGRVHSPADFATELCDEIEAALRLRLSVATLRRRRQQRQPPVWVKLGSRVFYRKQDLESFIAANIVCLPHGEEGDAR